MIAAFVKGDVDHARAVNARLLPSHRFQSSDTRPQPHPGQSHVEDPGLAGGPVPAAARSGSRGARGRRPRGLFPAPWLIDPVRIVFLGGLGEIGRNCACFEVDGRIMILDCGLMFPDIDMPGIDLVLPDFSYLRENADRVEGCIVTHGHEDHCGGLSFLLRELSFPDLRLGADPRAGPQPHRGGRPARPDRAHPGARRGAPPDRPVRRGVHPRHPLGAPRLRHRLPHPEGRDPALGRLQDRPDARRRALDRSGQDRRPGRRAGDPAAAVGLHQRRGGGPHRQRTPGRRGARRPVRRPPGQADHRGLLRQPHPPGPADRRRRHRQRPGPGHPGPFDGQERGPGPLDGPAAHPGRGPGRHRAHRRLRPSPGVRRSPPAPRASPCRPWP